MHDFIVEQNAYWLFGLEYIKLESEVHSIPGTKKFRYDLILHRRDGFLDLAELKGPNERLFDKRTTNRNKPNVKLAEAIGQAFTYLYAIDRTEQDIVKPRAYIVIGKQETDNSYERRVFSSFINNIYLITYSDLYQRGLQLLKYLKK